MCSKMFILLFSSPEPKVSFPPKVLVIPRKRWLRPDMTVNVLTGTLNLNTNKVSILAGSRAGVGPSVHIFRHIYLCNQQAHCNQILSEALFGRGKGCIKF